MTCSIWALGDLHLSFGTPNKSMSIYGKHWEQYEKKIEESWNDLVQENDLVLIPGDISWASSIEQALPDLKWIDSLKGHKIMIKGNHDYWWPSMSKLKKILPPSLQAIQNDSIKWKDVCILGTRLWDTNEYQFSKLYPQNLQSHISSSSYEEEDLKIFERELKRLELSLQTTKGHCGPLIAMTHYPPIGCELLPSKASALIESYGVSACVFGHLHAVDRSQSWFGSTKSTRYILTSCDYLDFTPIKILSL